MTNKVQLCRIIYYSLAALRISSDIFAHHQEHHCKTAVPASVAKAVATCAHRLALT